MVSEGGRSIRKCRAILRPGCVAKVRFVIIASGAPTLVSELSPTRSLEPYLFQALAIWIQSSGSMSYKLAKDWMAVHVPRCCSVSYGLRGYGKCLKAVVWKYHSYVGLMMSGVHHG